MSVEQKSPLDGLIEVLRLKETSKITKKADGFDKWFNSYGNIFVEILAAFRGTSYYQKNRKILDNSLVFGRFVELHKNLNWIFVCVLSGSYHSAIRELRFVLDSMLQAYYLDKEHPAADVPCKLEVLREIERERFGSRIIERIAVQDKAAIRDLYHELSQFVHSSYQEMKSVLDQGLIMDRVTFDFDQASFDYCRVLTTRVLDVFFLLTLQNFPELIGQIKSETQTSLADGYLLSLNYISQGEKEKEKV